MFNGYYSVILWWIAISCCSTTHLDVKLNNDNAGYFIKPVFRGEDFFGLNKEEKPFVITQNSRASSFEVRYGPFTEHQSISDPVGKISIGNHSSFGNGMILNDLEISAHLVSITVPPERPLLQVLFHASQIGDKNQNERSSSNRGSCMNGLNNAGRHISPSCLCMQVHIQKDSEELTSVCVLGEDQLVCIAEVKVPLSWWDPSLRPRSVNVYYSVYSMGPNFQCSTSRNRIVPSSLHSNSNRINAEEFQDNYPKTYPIAKRFVSSVSLSHGQLSYQELKEDQNILIYVPQKSFSPGSQFRVPVKLQVGSHLNEFTIRVRCKPGLSIVGGEASLPDTWSITLDGQTGDRKSAATATRGQRYYKRDRIEEVFKWVFQVDESYHAGHADDESGRITFILEYNSEIKKGRGFAPNRVDNRVVAKVQIEHVDIYAIVPVVKTTELINTAIITGREQNLSLQIYGVSQNSQVTDITSETTCQSGDNTVLKVSSRCDTVYLDGTETKGSSVNVIAKYGRHSRFLFFMVWVPELPLDIELSDQRLSQIKTWRVPARERSPMVSLRKGYLHDDHPFDDPEEEGPCQLKFQQSLVEVYARFYYSDVHEPRYLVHRKAMFRVTDLVVRNLRVSDQSVARLTGNVVEGLQPGNTEIQVMSSSRRPIGAKEMKVANDKVSLRGLKVKVISGLDVAILPVEEIPGALVAQILTKSELVSHAQEAILDVTVMFSDDTQMPLEFVPDTDYSLDVTTLNRHVIGIEEQHSPDTPKIIVKGYSQNVSVRVDLEVGRQCRKKKTMIGSFVDVDIEELPLAEQPVDPGSETGDLEGDENGHKNVHGKGTVTGGKMTGKNSKKGPNHEAQQQPVKTQREMSPLEIGMYVLLGIFLVAIIVFAINCVVFVNRYKKKRPVAKHKRESVSNANDWVWIGKDTLERNAINTCCNQALMSDQDFTVTRNVARFLLPHSNPSSNRSSCTTANGGGSSNRNSMISTYKGSECSIRITPNPIAGSGEGQTMNAASESSSNTVPRQRTLPSTSTRPPLQTFHTPLRDGSGTMPRKSLHYAATGGTTGAPLSDIQSTSAISSSDERGSCSSLPSRWSSLRGTSDSSGRTYARVPTPLQQKRLAMVATEMAQRGPLVEQKDLLVQAATQIAEHEEDVANGNLTDSSVEWDYEAMGMTYEQLMEYFDNLKESTA